MKRKSIRIGILLAVVILVAVLLKSFAEGYAREEIAAQLRAIGLETVEIAKVDLGFSRIGASGIVLGDSSTDAMWIEIDQLNTDLTPWQVLRGSTTPQHVLLDRVRVACHIDRDLSLKSWSIPSDLRVPSVEIRRGQVTLLQENTELVSAIDIQADVSGDPNLKAIASIGDALGTTWELKASLRDNARIEISTPAFRMSDEQLNKIPSLPRQLKRLKEFTAAMTIAVELSNFDQAEVAYKIELGLRSLHARVPAADFEVDQGIVDLVVDNNSAQLRRLTGNFAGGQVSLTGELHLENDSYEASVAGQIDGLTLKELPKTWKIPPGLTGQCDGNANLDLRLDEDEFVVTGELKGTINEATAAGLALRPITFDVSLDRYQVDNNISNVVGHLTINAGADVDLTELLSTLDPESRVAASNLRGALSVDINLNAPLDGLDDANQYQGSGTLTSATVSTGTLDLRQLRSELEIREGELINRLSCRVGDGTIAGNIRAELLGSKGIHATFDVHQLQLDAITELLPEAIAEAQGDVSGKATVEGCWEQLGELSAWSVDGQLQTSRAQWSGQSLSELSTSLRMQDSTVRLDDFRCTWADTRINAAGSIDLTSTNEFQIRLNVDKANLATIGSQLDLLSDDTQLRAVASVQGELIGSLNPLTWSSNGATTFDELRLPSFHVDGCRFQWQMNQQELLLSELAAEAYGGRITGKGTVPFDGKPYQLKGEFRNVDSSSLSVGAAEKARLKGFVSGTFALSGVEVDELPQVELQIRSPSISAFGTQASLVEGSATYDAKRLSLRLKGNALDGSFLLAGTATGEQADLSDLAIRGRIQTQDVELATLGRLLKAEELTELEGTARLDLRFAIAGPSLTPTCRGECVITNVRWGRTRVISAASAELVLSADAVRIQNVSAQFAEGTATGEFTVMRESNEKSFRLTLRNIRARRLTRFGPAAFSDLDGRINLFLEGTSKKDWRGRGQLDMARAELAGMTIQRVKVPFQWAFLPQRNRWIVLSRDAHANVARGRVSAELLLATGRRIDFKCTGRLERINLPTILRRVPGVDPAVDGTMSAQFKLSGRDVRSLNDVTGSYQAKVVQSRVLMLPILREMATSLGLGPLTLKFDVAQVQGRLTRGGVLRIDQMSLANNKLQMDASGKIWLNGRIDLDVTAHVGEFAVETALEQMIASPLQVLRTASVERLLQAGEFLERRLLFLNLGGTIRNPTINPRPNQNLDRDAILFFVDQASTHLLN